MKMKLPELAHSSDLRQRFLLWLGTLLASAGTLCRLPAFAGSPPVVTGVSAAQRPPTDAHPKYVDISYTISDPDSATVSVNILVSKDSGATWTLPAKTFTGNGAPNHGMAVTATPTVKTAVWDASADWDGHFTPNCRVRVTANDIDNFNLIPAGSYLRGNPPALGDTDITDAPQYSVYVSDFYMDANLVTGGLWNRIRDTYADSHGYTFDDPGTANGVNYPVVKINWYDAVKWCNARSELEGLMPVYYTDATFYNVYRTGDVDAVYMKPGANGFRLPTEAEWEKAARGGLTGNRFPWGHLPMADSTISESQANYYGDSEDYSYDLGPDGLNPIGYGPSPVGSFAPNNYGLYDMAGNVQEWCWDWYDANYYRAQQSDPTGPTAPGQRVIRGGAWAIKANNARTAWRSLEAPGPEIDGVGFRTVRGL